MTGHRIHHFPLRVYYEDTDAGGIVYYANYLRFLERARTELLREHGFHQSAIARDEQIIFVVGEVAARYVSPARLDDELVVATHVTHLGGASLQLQQNVLKRVDNSLHLLLKGNVTLVAVTLAGKTKRIDDSLRTALTPYLQTKDDNA